MGNHKENTGDDNETSNTKRSCGPCGWILNEVVRGFFVFLLKLLGSDRLGEHGHGVLGASGCRGLGQVTGSAGAWRWLVLQETGQSRCFGDGPSRHGLEAPSRAVNTLPSGLLRDGPVLLPRPAHVCGRSTWQSRFQKLCREIVCLSKRKR